MKCGRCRPGLGSEGDRVLVLSGEACPGLVAVVTPFLMAPWPWFPQLPPAPVCLWSPKPPGLLGHPFPPGLALSFFFGRMPEKPEGSVGLSCLLSSLE